MRAGVQDAMINDGIFGMSRHKEDLCAWPANRNLAGDLASTDGRHDDVGQQQIDVPGVRLAKLRDRWAVRGDQNGIAAACEDGMGQVANLFVVFDQQNGFGATNHSGRAIGAHHFHGAIVNPGQVNFECGSVARLAVNPRYGRHSA